MIRNRTKFSESLSLMGKTKKTSWFHNKFKEGRFYNQTPSYADDLATKIDKMITILNKIFEDKWDFIVDKDSNLGFGRLTLGLIIHFDKLEITNSQNLKHTINGLAVFTRIDFVQDEIKMRDIQGFRTSLSEREWSCGYLHSHLTNYHLKNTMDLYGLLNFCLGENEVAEMRMQLNDEFSEDLFELFCLTLTSMVSWESLEGIPHYKISDMASYNPNTPSINTGRTDLLKLCLVNSKSINYREKLKELSFYFINNRYNIKVDQKLHDILKDLIIEIDPTCKYGYLYIENATGRHMYSEPIKFSYDEINDRFKYSGTPARVVIGAKEYPFEVQIDKNNERTEEDLSSYKVEASLLESFITKIENEIYEKAIKRGISRKADLLCDA